LEIRKYFNYMYAAHRLKSVPHLVEERSVKLAIAEPMTGIAGLVDCSGSTGSIGSTFGASRIGSTRALLALP
jgi:hypothetical protein